MGFKMNLLFEQKYSLLKNEYRRLSCYRSHRKVCEVVHAYQGKTYQYFCYKILNLTNLQIKTILNIKFSDGRYMNNYDAHI